MSDELSHRKMEAKIIENEFVEFDILAQPHVSHLIFQYIEGQGCENSINRFSVEKVDKAPNFQELRVKNVENRGEKNKKKKGKTK